jgi:hypothetical protein
MAKDPAMSGPVSKPEGGHYESSEEIRAKDSGLTRSEVINTFGEDLGNKLLDGGYSSLSGMIDATDEDFLAITGIGPAALAKIREALTLVVVEEAESGLEEETPDEPEVEEAVGAEVETAEELPEETPDEAVSEEVLPGPPPTEIQAPPEPEVVGDPMLGDVPFGTEGGMSVRVRANKIRAAKEEAERKRRAAIEDQHAVPDDVGVVDLGSVDVDFVPIPDPPGEPPEPIDIGEVVTPPAVEEGEGGTEPEVPATE